MPDWLLAGFVAVPVASGMSALQLVTSKYPNTWFLLTPRKSKAFYVYCIVVYGGAAFLTTLSLNSLIANETVTVKVKWLDLESPWVRAVIVGLTTRALFQISFFDITAGPRTVPIGPALIVQPMEPWLLDKVQQAVDGELRRFAKRRAEKYPELDDVRQKIKSAPHSLPEPEHIAFASEIDKATTVEEAMEKHVNALGRKSFNTAFPA